MPEKSKLNYFKWFVSDTELLEDQLDLEQIGTLFIAVMKYVRDGVEEKVPDAIKWPYADYRRRVDASRSKYDNKCATNAANGRKGGQAKASKARAAAGEKKFKPPTRTIFRTAAKHFLEEGEIDAEKYDIDCFFEELENESWRISGEPIINRDDWETALIAKFPNETAKEDIAHFSLGLWTIFSKTFKMFHGLHNNEGLCYAELAAKDFCKEYDESIKGWNINNKIYGYSQLDDALLEYVTTSPEYSDLAKIANATER